MLQTLARTLEVRGYLLAPVINNVLSADKDGAGHIPSSRRHIVTSSHCQILHHHHYTVHGAAAVTAAAYARMACGSSDGRAHPARPDPGEMHLSIFKNNLSLPSLS